MEHQDGTNETQGRNELAQLTRRSQWIAWGVSLPLVMLAAPLLLHLPMSGPYISADRTAFFYIYFCSRPPRSYGLPWQSSAMGLSSYADGVAGSSYWAHTAYSCLSSTRRWPIF